MAERPPSSTRPAPAGDRSRRGGRCLEHGEDYSREGGSHPEHRQHGVVEDAADAADPHLLGASLAAVSLLRVDVPAALLLLVVPAVEAHRPLLAPRRAPGVLDRPVLHRPDAGLLLDAPGVQRHRVVDHVARVATLLRHHAPAVVVPMFAYGHGHVKGAVNHEAPHDGFLLVLRQLCPAPHADGHAPELGLGSADEVDLAAVHGDDAPGGDLGLAPEAPRAAALGVLHRVGHSVLQ
mmetsp:Transcript_102335/g.289862  ORF Transcript_102335/g.289862 Transcript_102335/m.289862 type:complete len:236 (-) Transcript_102335:874-1581(-)